ncbi:LOW QUALITY PROTEIN: hypothetical protein M513_10477 [Trichuris suis]|uniref:PID domain-containing protein n=1 Tax=Trichuris suis TaxID=68888 RepID=A0A085LUH6_9BILA|nr:LOW QUALITY PROTEIN: hypothetical protein M513_10477 [Trichuris suis]
MPTKHGQYDSITEDPYDPCIPLYNEVAFQHGIHFEAKYIGSMEMFRPASRIEIVAAMRRVRYEFKARGISKKKVDLIISVDGIKVIMQNRKKKHNGAWDESECLVMFHPIYRAQSEISEAVKCCYHARIFRIFYVSHDSQDLQIFSYIARDGVNNTFKCNVFKCSKKMTTDASRFYYLRLMSKRRSSADAGSIKLSKPKFAQWSKDALERTPVLDEDPELESQAIRIVRTIGQAFEVCHKINTEQSDEVEEEEEADDEGSREPAAAGPSGQAPVVEPTTADKAPLIMRNLNSAPSSVAEEPLVKFDIPEPSQSSRMPQADKEKPETSGILKTVEKAPLAHPPPKHRTSMTSEIGIAAAAGTSLSAAPAEQSSSSASSGAMKYGLPGSSAGASDKSPSMASIPSSNIPVVPPAASTQQQPIRMMPGQQAAFSGLPVAVAGPSQMPTEGGIPGAVVCAPQVSVAQQQPGFPYSQTWSGALPAQTAWSQYNSMGRESSDLLSPLSPTSSVRGMFPFNITSPPSYMYSGSVPPVQQLFASPAGFFSPERISSPMPLSAAPCVPDPGASSTSQPTTLGRAMENFNLTVLRAQLDQAQQQAQVAIAQVNLLREQLSVETTARLESQSRTQQLLLANKELIEQVHSLVSRLQMLETRIVGASTNPNIPTLLKSAPSEQEGAAILPTSSALQKSIIDTAAVVRQQLQQQQQSQLANKLKRDERAPAADASNLKNEPIGSTAPKSSRLGQANVVTSGTETSDTATSDYSSSELDIATKYAAALNAMAQQYAERGIASPVKYGSKKELNVYVSPSVSKYGERQSPPVATGRRTGPVPVSKLARAVTVSSFDQRLKGLPKTSIERFESIPSGARATGAHASVTELKELPKETPAEKVAVESSSSPVRFGGSTLRTAGGAKVASTTESPSAGHVNKARHPLKLVKKQITSDNLLLSRKLDPSLLAALGNRLPVVENHIGSGRTENESRLTALLGGPKVVPPLAIEELRKQSVHKAPIHAFTQKQRLSDPSVISSTTSDQNHGNKGGGGDQTAQAAQASAHGNR